MIETWRKVLREGFMPLFADRHLEVAKEALEKDDARLIQGSTTTPPPLMCVQDWPVEAACLLGFCAWQGEEDCTTVGKVEERFAKFCSDADQRLGEPAACRHFLNWFDDTPREQMIRELLFEVNHEIGQRLMTVVLPATEISDRNAGFYVGLGETGE